MNNEEKKICFTRDMYENMLSRSVWTGKEMVPYINDGDVMEEQIQKNGIDLRADKIFRLMGCPSFSHNEDYEERSIQMEEYPSNVGGLDNLGWNLEPGFYVVQWVEKIKIPKFAIGILLPRSSMIRNGITVTGAFWDRGYEGIGQSGLIVSSNGVLLECYYRIAQIAFIGAINDGESYDGRYQGENLDAQKEKDKENKKEIKLTT